MVTLGILEHVDENFWPLIHVPGENQVYFGHETWKRRKKEECAPIGQAINLHLASYYRQRQKQKRTSGRPIASDLLGDKQRSYVSNSRFDIQ